MARDENDSRRLMGGAFGLPAASLPNVPLQRAAPDFLTRSAANLVNARSAFWVLAKTLLPRCVWLPSYLCSAIVDGFRAAGCRVEFFPVNAELACVDDSWLARVAPGDCVVRIHYFGFVNDDPVFPAARARGARLIDDAAQALLTPGVGRESDALVFSPRKFVGVPDGACMVPLGEFTLAIPPLEAPPTEWWRQMLAATELRRDFDLGASKGTGFELFQAAERSAPIGLYAMSEFSRRLLEAGFDYTSVAEARRRNYTRLAEHLGEFAVFPALPAEVVPLGFPVMLAERDRVRRALFREQIFPPVHWPLAGTVPEEFAESHRFSDRVMTLPCDQRYGPDDMQRAIDVFLNAVRNRN
jgi:hypothetical protein